MNERYYRMTQKLKDEYHRSFNSGEDEKIFKFLRMYMQFIENDNSSYNILILFEDPLRNEENRFFLRDVNRNCRNFLESKESSKGSLEDKETTGLVFCYIGFGYEYGVFEYYRDQEMAYEKYLISAQLNNDLGTYRLAECYEQGKGTDRDIDKAFYFYRCAAKLGIVDALHVYGTMIKSKDQKTGLHYLSCASIKADKIYPHPLYDIGKWYETKQETLDVCMDEEYSFDVYMKGAKLDDSNCQYRVAKCFENGELKRNRNMNKAVKWYKLAAENGHVDAQMILFGLYSTGVPNVIERDLSKAYYWALRAGIKCNPRASLYLGEYSKEGLGVESDILLALWWYTISVTMGSYEARIKYEDTRREVEKRDLGPEIPYKCCFIWRCN